MYIYVCIFIIFIVIYLCNKKETFKFFTNETSNLVNGMNPPSVSNNSVILPNNKIYYPNNQNDYNNTYRYGMYNKTCNNDKFCDLQNPITILSNTLLGTNFNPFKH
jgi:hypothetical protein